MGKHKGQVMTPEERRARFRQCQEAVLDLIAKRGDRDPAVKKVQSLWERARQGLAPSVILELEKAIVEIDAVDCGTSEEMSEEQWRVYDRPADTNSIPAVAGPDVPSVTVLGGIKLPIPVPVESLVEKCGKPRKAKS